MNPPEGVLRPPGPGSQTKLQQMLAEALRDRYVLECEIAQGGMATVYLGREVGREQRVAVKVMHPEVATVIGAERFRREIEIVRGMSHPGIVPLTDFGTAAGLLCYVMPYIDGESVYEPVQREGRFPLHDALRITHEIAEALGYAHARGVLHRDVKPENILLAGYSPRDGGAAASWRALVADFGLARAIGAAEYQRLTETGVIVGTVFYMSPEQLREDRDLDQRADIYSLGCILYEMLTGAPPYTGSSISDIVRRILRVPPPRRHGRIHRSRGLSIWPSAARSPGHRASGFSRCVSSPTPCFQSGPSRFAPGGDSKRHTGESGVALLPFHFATPTNRAPISRPSSLRRGA